MNNFIQESIEEDFKTLIKKALAPQDGTVRANIYQGKVVANNDPEKKGRCRVRVLGIFGDSISDDDLPWAIPDFSFIGSEIGSFVVPSLDTIVNIYFEDDNIYLPHYTTKVIRQDKLKSMTAKKNDDYPNTMVFFETDAGDYFSINRTKQIATFKHASGLIITIDATGNMLVDNTQTTGTVNIKVAGDVDISSQGTVTLQSAEQIKLIAGNSSLWQPNVIPTCPFTGAPHSLTQLPLPGLSGS